MKKLRRSSVKNNDGFTLIELMVVIVVLGLLAGIITPKIFGYLADAKIGAAKSDIESLSTALRMYKLDNGSYPTTEQGLKALVEAPSGAKNWRTGGYLEKKVVPKDPWKNDYAYICPGVHGDYDLLSFGKDGQSGGEGEDKDINNWDVQ